MVAELPEAISFDLGRTNLLVDQRCGNCKHLKRIAHPAYEKPCIDLGKLDISKPCARFSADPTKIRLNNRLARIAVELIQELSDDKLALMSSIFNEERKTRRYGFTFGQNVYLNIYGGEYISNYRRMKVVSATKDYVNLIADEGFTAMVYSKNVLTPAQWRKKEAWLIRNERIKDPNLYKYTRSSTQAELQLEKAKHKISELEFDATSKHNFSKTRGSMGGGKLAKYSNPDSHRSLTSLIRVR